MTPFWSDDREASKRIRRNNSAKCDRHTVDVATGRFRQRKL